MRVVRRCYADRAGVPICGASRRGQFATGGGHGQFIYLHLSCSDWSPVCPLSSVAGEVHVRPNGGPRTPAHAAKIFSILAR